MKGRVAGGWLWLLTACAAVGIALAGDSPLYTNADLERLPVLPDSSVQVERPSEEAWSLVVDYLERQYARIDADRRYVLERRLTDAEVDALEIEARRSRYSLPYNYYFWDGRWRVGRRDDELRFAGRRSLEAAALSAGPIRPLHAGPTRAQLDYFRASRRSGTDAFPSNSRSATPSKARGGPRR